MTDYPEAVNETPAAVLVYVTCQEAGCPNHGKQIAMLLEPGTPVQCGPCKGQISDTSTTPTT